MSFPDARKLKRGLKDISPLFEEPASVEAAADGERSRSLHGLHPPALEILSVFSPDNPNDSLFLNTFLASQIALPQRPCSIFSLHDSCVSENQTPGLHPELKGFPSVQSEHYGDNLKRYSLSWEQFEQICRWPLRREHAASSSGEYLFLDFESLYSPQIETVISMLDKWVFLLRPNLESLTETYKLIKAASETNRRLTYFILFEGYPEDQKGCYLFEKFSDMVSKHLSIQLYWLGYLNLTRSSQYIATELVLDTLFLKAMDEIHSTEKIAIGEFMQEFSHGSTPGLP